MPTERNKVYLIQGVLAIIWGTSFILIKRGLVVYTPFQVGALRMFVAFIFMFPFIMKHFGSIDKSHWKYLIASGFLGNGIPSILFPLAQTHINSALAGMINSLTPIFALIVGIIFFGMKVGMNRIAGLIIGLFGAVLLIAGQTNGKGVVETNAFALYVVLSTICYAFSLNILRYKLANVDALRITGFALFFAGLPLGFFLFSTDFIHRTQTMDGAGFSFLCIVLLGFFSTSLSTILFNKLIKISGALSAASVTYLIPIVAVLWGLWDHEIFGMYQFLGMGAILVGVYLVNRQKRAEAKMEVDRISKVKS